MAVERQHDVEAGDGWAAAVRLAQGLERGWGLPGLGSPSQDGSDEILHARCTVDVFRCDTVTVVYHDLLYVDFGGRAGWEARPQWLPLGPTSVFVSDRRVGIAAGSGLASLWYSDGLELTPNLRHQRLDVALAGELAFAFEGAWAPYLTVVLAHAAHDEVVDPADPAGQPASAGPAWAS